MRVLIDWLEALKILRESYFACHGDGHDCFLNVSQTFSIFLKLSQTFSNFLKLSQLYQCSAGANGALSIAMLALNAKE